MVAVSRGSTGSRPVEAVHCDARGIQRNNCEHDNSRKQPSSTSTAALSTSTSTMTFKRLRSYSVRIADGTRTRNRTRCSELFLMMFAFRITISDPPISRLTCLQNSSLLSSSYPPNNTTHDQYNTIARPGPPWQSWIFSGANKK